MKKRVLLFGLVTVLVMAAVAVTVFAVNQGGMMTYLPGTADTVSNLPDADALPEAGTDGMTYSVSSKIPQREGYEFIHWTLDYGVASYRVTYVVNPDPVWAVPGDSVVPQDLTAYAPGDMVDVADQLTTSWNYAYNENHEKVLGTWSFVPWDKADFPIYEDTTITGGWDFEPAPAITYKYTVHYVLWDDYLKGIITKVAVDEERTIDRLGKTVTEPAKTGTDLKIKYRKNYIPVPGYESVTATINRDGYEIWIFYQKRSTSS